MGSGGEAFYGVPREYLVDVFRAHNTAAIEFASVDPEAADPRVHDPDHRRRPRGAGSGAHRARRRACGADSAQPVGHGARPVLGRGLRPAVGHPAGDGHPDQPARGDEQLPRRDHAGRPHAVQGNLPVAPADLHVGDRRELDHQRHPRALPRAQGRARRSRPRMDSLLPRAARHDGNEPRLGHLRGQGDHGEAELLLAPSDATRRSSRTSSASATATTSASRT